jgi:membrane protein DedA with SNARE-associated domain
MRMDAFITSTIAFIAENRSWAFWIALAFALVENIALISFIIPSTAILIGVGALVATGSLDFWPIWAGASIGAVIGSTTSWWLGLRYGEALLAMWPLRKYPVLVLRAKATLARHGPLAIIMGHFIGPLRPFMFLLTGMARMRFGTFQIYNVLGSLGWAYVTPKFGELGGLVIGWVWRMLGL